VFIFQAGSVDELSGFPQWKWLPPSVDAVRIEGPSQSSSTLPAWKINTIFDLRTYVCVCVCVCVWRGFICETDQERASGQSTRTIKEKSGLPPYFVIMLSNPKIQRTNTACCILLTNIVCRQHVIYNIQQNIICNGNVFVFSQNPRKMKPIHLKNKNVWWIKL